MPVQKIEPGDIYWVTLTSSGSEQNGRRPCIVMSRLAVNNAGRTVVVVHMTTTTSTANPYYRILIPVAEIIKDPNCGSAIQDSVAKCDHLRVLDKSLLESKIGKLTQTAVIAVGLGIAYVFDIR
jgi:mRNA-degrading endonuclease toxin of MazEF toxin-antitoxin module